MNNRFVGMLLLAMLSGFFIFLTGCSGIPGFQLAPNPTTQETELYSETVYIRNCADFENEKREALLERSPIVLKVTLNDKAISEESGEAVEIPAALKEKLETAITEEYKANLEEKQSKISDVDLVVPAYSIRIFEVQWTQECICSVVVFEMDKDIYTANFSYRLEYPTLKQSMQMACTA